MSVISDDVRALGATLHESPVAFAYFDSADRLVSWNEAYRHLNFAISELIQRGARFPDLLTALVVAGQIDIPEGETADWIAARLKARRFGTTAFRHLSDGRDFLVQERKDPLGGTVGVWIDVTDHFKGGVLVDGAVPDASTGLDPGGQDRLRSHLQTIYTNLDLLLLSAVDAAERRLIGDTIVAARAITDFLDSARG